MANIKLKEFGGAETIYNGVGIISVPLSTSGTMSYYDTSLATAMANDVRSGKIAFGVDGSMNGTYIPD